MKPDQQKYLFARLKDAAPSSHDMTFRSTPEVRAARRVVSAWERKVRASRLRFANRISKAKGKVQEVIYAGDYLKALAAVKVFEKRKGLK